MKKNKVLKKKIHTHFLQHLDFQTLASIKFLGIALLIIFTSLLSYFSSLVSSTPKQNTIFESRVIRVVDGDTIVIEREGVDETLRLIGIDAPESVHRDKSKNTKAGKISSAYLKTLLENKVVKIELDKRERDKYDRLLGYVFLEDLFVNDHLVEEGYAKAKYYPPNAKYRKIIENIDKK